MSTTSLYDGIVEPATDGGGTIKFERHLPFAIDEVWSAITDAERLRDWWLPFDAEITIDLQPGGEMVFAATGGNPPPMSCTVLTVDAPTLFEHTHMEPGSYMRWELSAVADGTVLRLSHFTPNAEAAIGMCFVVGLHTSLSRLEPALRGEPIGWDDDEFAVSQAAYAAKGFAPKPE